jgi:membrane protein implicated in regulation of membrane protease activity
VKKKFKQVIMVFKIWLAVGFASVTALMVIAMGLLHQARIEVILYRTAITFFLIGVLWYLVESFIILYVVPYFFKKNQGQQQDAQVENSDASIQQKLVNSEEKVSEAALDTDTVNDFAPLTKEDLDQVSTPRG